MMKKKKSSRSGSKVPVLDIAVVKSALENANAKKFESPDNQSKSSALKGAEKTFKRSNSVKKVAF